MATGLLPYRSRNAALNAVRSSKPCFGREHLDAPDGLPRVRQHSEELFETVILGWGRAIMEG